MIMVRIINPDHEHHGDSGELISKRTIDGRIIMVRPVGCSHQLFDWEFKVDKKEIKVIRLEKS